MESTDNDNLKEDGDKIALAETAGDLGASSEGIAEKLESLALADQHSTHSSLADDPPERSQLPYLKGDKQIKVSLWTLLKDSIGKDIWRITVPVYFNEPLGALQKCAGVTEYLDLLDWAVIEEDEARRIAIIAIHYATQYNNVERMGMSKPFNPMLGETFELSKPGQYRLIAE